MVTRPSDREAVARLIAQIRAPIRVVNLQPALLTRTPETGPVKNVRAMESEPIQAKNMKEVRDSESSDLKCNIPEVPRNSLWKTNLIIYFVTKKVFSLFPHFVVARVKIWENLNNRTHALGSYFKRIALYSFSMRQFVFIYHHHHHHHHHHHPIRT